MDERETYTKTPEDSTSRSYGDEPPLGTGVLRLGLQVKTKDLFEVALHNDRGDVTCIV